MIETLMISDGLMKDRRIRRKRTRSGVTKDGFDLKHLGLRDPRYPRLYALPPGWADARAAVHPRCRQFTSDTRHLLPIGLRGTLNQLDISNMVNVESRGQPESTQHLRLASFGVSQPSTTLRHRLTQIMAAAAYLIRTRPPSRRVRTPDYQFSVSFKRTTFEHSSTLTSFFPSFSIEKPSSSRIVRISKPQSKPHKQNKPRTNTRYSLLSKMSSFTSTFPVSVSELSAIPTVVSEQECTIEEVGDNR